MWTQTVTTPVQTEQYPDLYYTILNLGHINPPYGIGLWGMSEKEFREAMLLELSDAKVSGGFIDWDVSCKSLPRKYRQIQTASNLVCRIGIKSNYGLTYCKLTKKYEDKNRRDFSEDYFVNEILIPKYGNPVSEKLWRKENAYGTISELELLREDNNLIFHYKSPLAVNFETTAAILSREHQKDIL